MKIVENQFLHVTKFKKSFLAFKESIFVTKNKSQAVKLGLTELLFSAQTIF